MMKVIYVDDERLALKKFQLEATVLIPNVEVSYFDDPADALVYCRDNKVDYAFLDINMPNISGIELSKEIRSF